MNELKVQFIQFLEFFSSLEYSDKEFYSGIMARVFKSKSELLAEAKMKRAAANIIDKEVKKSKSVIKQWNKQGKKNGELGQLA